MTDAIKVFNPEHFESIRMFIQVENHTTRTDLKNGESIALIELGTKSLVLEIPKNAANKNHRLLLKIFRLKSKTELQKAKKKSSKKIRLTELLFEATGKITETESIDDNHLKVWLNLIQYDEKSWTHFKTLFSKRQHEINEFLSAIKGY